MIIRLFRQKKKCNGFASSSHSRILRFWGSEAFPYIGFPKLGKKYKRTKFFKKKLIFLPLFPRTRRLKTVLSSQRQEETALISVFSRASVGCVCAMIFPGSPPSFMPIDRSSHLFPYQVVFRQFLDVFTDR